MREWRRHTASGTHALGGFATAGLTIAVGLTVLVGADVTELAESNQVGYLAFGAVLLMAGYAAHVARPRTAVAPLLLGAATCFLTCALIFALLGWAARAGITLPFAAAMPVVAAYAWPWAPTVCLPVLLLLFPNGHFASKGWRWALIPIGLFGVLFMLRIAAGPGVLPSFAGGRNYPTIAALAPQAALVDVLVAASGAAAVCAVGTSLVRRYVRGEVHVDDGPLRPVVGLLIVLAGTSDVLPALGTAGIVGSAFAPVAVAAALLRRRPLDARSATRLLASALLVASGCAAFALLTGIVARALRRPVGMEAAIIAALAVATGFGALRAGMSRAGRDRSGRPRSDVLRVLTEVGARLDGTGDVSTADLSNVLHAMCRVLDLPYAEISTCDGVLVQFGIPVPALRTFALRRGDASIGTLTVGLRTGERSLSRADELTIGLLTTPLTLAVSMVRLRDELRAADARTAAAERQVRLDLRRDLHDDIGPLLTAVVLNADAAQLTVQRDTDAALALLAELRSEAAEALDAIRDVTRIAHPADLDSLGLAESLRQHARRLAGAAGARHLAVTVRVPDDLPQLPAAVEVTAYRIATEALTNVARHASATAVDVEIALDGPFLVVQVADNGRSSPRWHPGIGISSMRARVIELGGSVDIGPRADGGRVFARLPTETCR